MIGILYLIDSMNVGGTETQLVQLINRLDRGKFQPHLCTLKRGGELVSDINVPHLPLVFEGFTKPSLVPALIELVVYVRKHKIQIVQAFFQDPFLLAAMAKPFSNVKLIGSFRDMGFWRTPPENRKMRFSYQFFTGFIANAQAVKNHFVQIDGIPEDKIMVIYNGVGLEMRENTSVRQEQVVGIVANCNRRVKRVEDFVRAAAVVHQRLSAVKYIVIGDGYQRPILEQMSRSLGLAEVMTFAGSVARPMDYLCGFDVGVNTSETEGFCNAILEYMACGLPIVATAAGGNPELVQDEENGFLVPVGNVEKIAERIIQLIEDADLRAKFGSNSIKKVASLFSIQRMIDEHQDYYSKVLKGT